MTFLDFDLLRPLFLLKSLKSLLGDLPISLKYSTVADPLSNLEDSDNSHCFDLAAAMTSSNVSDSLPYFSECLS